LGNARKASAEPAIFRPEIKMDGVCTGVLVHQTRAADAGGLGDLRPCEQ